MKWITARQLEQWAVSPIAKLDLPGVVGDLIRASCRDISAFRFPSGDKGAVRGFDGHLISNANGFNVPLGRSFWEFGTEQDYRGKAKSDFDKRSSEVDGAVRRETTFVLVSPRSWDSSKTDNSIENWLIARKSESTWKDVWFLDGVALESWLQHCPAVAAWHARNTLKVAPLAGVRSTDEFWNEFANRYKPSLKEEVLLCERDGEVERLIPHLLGPSGTISFSADAPEEVLAFAVAAIRKARPELRLHLEARTLVIDDPDMGRQLLGNSDLVFLLRNEAARSPGLFGDVGPTLVPLGRQQKNGSAPSLTRPSSFAMGQALTTMELEENYAVNLARGCGRSLVALARRIPGGSYEAPAWLESAPDILPPILAGGWDAANEKDCEVLRLFAGADSYSKVESRLRPFVGHSDPPFDREGPIWKVRAPMDAFVHVGHLIGQEHLDGLRRAATAVFSELEPEETGTALFSLEERSKRYSSWIRDGLATTLLLIAVWEKEADLNLGPKGGQGFVNDLIQALPGLSANHRLLASLRDELPLLAEAAPVPLLAALEHLLKGNGEGIRPIFEEAPGALFPKHQHVGLLWALEMLAWLPAHFDRTVQILARLAALDPGGKIANRPFESLKKIFVSWNPQTSAPLKARLAALKAVLDAHPEIGWRLINSLLPRSDGFMVPTPQPRLRELGPSRKTRLLVADQRESDQQIIRHAFDLAGDNSDRWSEIVAHIANFPPTERKRVADRLDHVLGSLGPNVREPLWSKLQDFVSRHTRFSTMKWALPAAELSPFRSLLDRHRPADAASSVVWLFDTWSLDEDPKAGAERRMDAMRKLVADQNIDEILKVGTSARYPHLVWEALAGLRLSPDELENLLVKGLRDSPTSQFVFGLASLHRRAIDPAVAPNWICHQRMTRGWTDEVSARILLAWPQERSTWHALRLLGPAVVDQYWRLRGHRPIDGRRRDLIYVVLNFLKRGHALAALGSIMTRLQELPTPLAVRILDGLVPEINREKPNSVDGISYEVEQLLAELDKRDDITSAEIARREYALLQLLDHSSRKLRIHELMASDADFYHHILRQLFRGKNEPRGESSPAIEAAGRQAYDLLKGFSTLPGENGGVIDEQTLSAWIDRVRALGLETDRAEITEQYIGHLLAHTGMGADGAWPNEVVRNQIERLRSDEVDQGLMIERYNMRGVFSKSTTEGGAQERVLAASYRGYAATAVSWPRTASLLNRIAEGWEADAAREDLEVRQRQLKT